MKGKSYSIPFGMVFKKYHCHKCGDVLRKERTHRIVNKDDKDYYNYQDPYMFPKNDWDVYEHRFMCPKCGNRISFDEQCIIERIQKMKNSKTLSNFEIKEAYEESKAANDKRVLIRNILIPTIFNLLIIVLYYFFGTEKSINDAMFSLVLYLIITGITLFGVISSYYGSRKRRIHQSYSFQHESKMRKLHVYSSHNRELILRSNKCYCFYCKSIVSSNEIIEYIDNNETALCPKCDIDSIIPDAIDDTIDQKVIDDMNQYWF